MSFGAKAMMAVGLILLLAAAATGWRAFRFVSTAQHAVGVVVRSAPDEPGDRSPGHPIIQFTTADGHTVRAFQHSGASTPYGTRLPVIYARTDPESASMASFWSIWVVPLIFAWLGAILFIGPFFGLRPYLRA